MSQVPEINFKSIPKSLIILAGLFFLLPSAFVIIDAGHVGVVKKLGAVQSEPLTEGFHFKTPFIDKIVEVDVRLQTIRSSALSASKDLQTVKTVVTVQGSLMPTLAPIMYQKVGSIQAINLTIIQPAIKESVKAITAKYTAEELVTRRGEVKIEIQKSIQSFIDTTLDNKKIKNGIEIANVAITDFDFSDEFNRAIELKVKAEQEALQAKNEKIKRVTQAEAAAAEKKLAADASAYEITAGSRARADAIKREAQALKGNPALIQLRLAEKWDGKLPKFNGSSAVPFININDKD
ncbi:HflC protein [Candidatus Marinamargulisbacteria bacterium SCGC AAA071-K20]|nr:HflC protein [Candidatus Marinamargulisbacteria bacterium SCGC AAA071-K20]